MNATAVSTHEARSARAGAAAAACLRLIAAAGGDGGVSLARRLTDRFPRSLDPGRDAVVRRGGFTFRLDTRDYLQRHLYYTGSFEPAVRGFLLSQARPGDVCVDAGANIGIYALPLARRLDRLGAGHVLAFDPSPEAGEALQRSARRAGLANLRCISLALGAPPSRRRLLRLDGLPEGDLGSATLYGQGVPTVDVEVETFDRWAAREGLGSLDLVKIDVEGSELDVLRGMTSSIETFRPRAIVIEIVAAHLDRAGTSVTQVSSLVAALGYREDGPSINDVAAGRCGRLGGNVVLRPCEAGPATFRLRHGTGFRLARSLMHRVLPLGRRDER
jgi:FkbM family methyltransferase